MSMSDGFTIDSTPPKDGQVNDGLDMHSNRDFMPFDEQALSASWFGFYDDLHHGSDGMTYRAGVSKCSADVESVELFDVGTVTQHTFVFLQPPISPPSPPDPAGPPWPACPPAAPPPPPSPDPPPPPMPPPSPPPPGSPPATQGLGKHCDVDHDCLSLRLCSPPCCKHAEYSQSSWAEKDPDRECTDVDEYRDASGYTQDHSGGCGLHTTIDDCHKYFVSLG